MFKGIYFLILIFVISCASVVAPSKKLPSYISQENGQYYITLIFDHIPTYRFLIDDIEINHDFIKYQKLEIGHLIKIPVSKENKQFKVVSTLQTILKKEIHLTDAPQKVMMIASYSAPLMKAIKSENPDILVVFAPPGTQYYEEKDFLDTPIFYQNDLRVLYVVGHRYFKSNIESNDLIITDTHNVGLIDRPAILTHYLPFTHQKSQEQFVHLSEYLKDKGLPVVFLSSFTSNLIQQIPRGELGLPSYEFSIKNNFLALPHVSNSPWEMIQDRRADYLTLDLKFLDSYWHIYLKGKDDNQEMVFLRDLTLYQVKPLDGRNRRQAR